MTAPVVLWTVEADSSAVGASVGRSGTGRTAATPAPSTAATLEAAGLTKSFGAGDQQTFALQDVSITLRAGEFSLLMGPSGSGKSTLLAVISALLRPDAGSVSALGHDVWHCTERELEQFRLKHCSYIFQGYNLFPALTAAEQLEIVLKWGERVSTSEAKKRAEAVLGQLGLSNKLRLRPAQLSGGEKQRVAIGRALVKNPAFLFADEPTSALDWENGQQVVELLRAAAHERGATVLVVTHDHRLVPFADRVFEMTDGRLANSEGEPAGAHRPRGEGGAAEDSDPGLYLPRGPRLELRDPAA